MSDFTAKQLQQIKDINAIVYSQLEYAESHVDAGEGYAHIPKERGLDETEFAASLAKFNIATCGLSLSDIWDLALDLQKMQSGTIYHPTDVIVLCSFPISEVEIQIDFSDCGIESKEELEIIESELVHIGNRDDSSMLAYSTSDSVWYATVNPNELRTAINEKAFDYD